MTPLSQAPACIVRMIEASRSEYRDVLELLFYNWRDLPQISLFPLGDAPAIIEVMGSPQDASGLISFTKSRFPFQIPDDFLDRVVELSSQASQIASIGSVNKAQLVQMIEKLGEAGQIGPPSLIQTEVADWMAATLLESLVDSWRRMPAGLKSTHLLQCCRVLRLVHPMVQVSGCGRCQRFELIMGSAPERDVICDGCHRAPVTSRAYRLDPEFADLQRRNNNALPIFIAEYITRVTKGAVRPEPNKWLSKDVEVDVLIPETSTAVQCRLYRHVGSPVTDDRIASHASEFGRQITNTFRGAGVARVIVAVNFGPQDTGRLERVTLQKLGQAVPQDKVKFVPGNVQDLLALLQSEIKLALRAGE